MTAADSVGLLAVPQIGPLRELSRPRRVPAELETQSAFTAIINKSSGARRRHEEPDTRACFMAADLRKQESTIRAHRLGEGHPPHASTPRWAVLMLRSRPT